MTERLSAATLDRIPPEVQRPAYDRAALMPGVVHIGLGAFHRAHQAPLFDVLAASGDLRWGVVGSSLRSPAVRDALKPQDCLYSLTVEEGQERETSVIGIIRDVIVAPEESRRLIDAIASPHTHLVTVTVTEKGYNLDPASGLLDEHDPGVCADLASLEAPSTMPGYIAAGLILRKRQGLPPLSILSCDNLSANGSKLAASVIRIARAHDKAAAAWIAGDCAFPNSMVDRIVPATREADVVRTASVLGVIDAACLRTEPFWQWVIEDRFAGETPDFAQIGVQLASDVGLWEKAKLRLLNGAHSAMAYLGALAGLKTVDEFVRWRAGAEFLGILWDELESTLETSPQLDLEQYRDQLMRRFSNRALDHKLHQIAMDGSQKIPQRLVAPAIEILSDGRRTAAVALVLAAWMQWQTGREDSGQPFEVDDPLASTTRRMVAGAADSADLARSLLRLEAVFPERLASDPEFERMVAGYLDDLRRLGARETVERFVIARDASVGERSCG